MNHAILVCAYKDVDHLKYLVRQFDEKFDLFIHLDRKFKFSEEEISDLRSISNVKAVISTYKVNWGGSHLLFAMIRLMQIAKEMGDYDYFHTVSGQDIVIKSCADFQNHFIKNKGKEFLEFFSLPTDKWEKGGMERLERFHFYNEFNSKANIGFKIIKLLLKAQKLLRIKTKAFGNFPIYYGGSCWFSISNECVDYCLNYIENNPDIFSEIKYTLLIEEVFFQTLILNSPFKDRVLNDNLRYIDWEFRNGNSPAVLDVSDKDKIDISDKLIARKIEPSISRFLIEHIGSRRG